MNETDNSDRGNTCRTRAEEFLGTKLSLFENPLTVLASPAWRGVEGDIWRCGTDKETIVLKHFHDDVGFYVDVEAAMAATEQAGNNKCGPRVIQQWDNENIIALEDLNSPWRAGGLHDALDSEVRANVIAQKKHFQKNATLIKHASIFDEIETLQKIADRENITTHKDIDVFNSFFKEANFAFGAFGTDSMPCHRDGNTANLMVNTDKKVRLLDFDLAANCDPFEELGCFLIEYFECDADARVGFEEWYGVFDESLFQRSMVYGLADHLRWGLIGSIMAAKSPRRSLEFTKYAAWRFLRLETQVKRSDANDRIRKAA